MLLAVKGVGPTVIARLEQLGVHTLQTLAACHARHLTEQAAALLGSACWRNSPQAQAAMRAAIAAAQARSPTPAPTESPSIR